MHSKSENHSQIREVQPNIFFVTGINIYFDDKGVEQQHSRNMIIIREKTNLSLINTVRLTEEGLQELEKLGKIVNVVRIGAFHDRDDDFYCNRYQAKLWALPGMKHKNNRQTDIELTPNGTMPFSNSSLVIFKTSIVSEGIFIINEDVIVSCDSIKNWENPDPFFSETTANAYEKAGFFGKAKVSKIWREHCQVQLSDFMQLKDFNFKHLLSAHGEPLLNLDKNQLLESIKSQYGQNNKL
ncbi:MAG: hypothetical protein H0U57_06955 [Tatlockia sp.]|nr:hypothetical protein [Tatlockia sp.]